VRRDDPRFTSTASSPSRARPANLSGIDGRTDLAVKTVVQQAFVEVDEQGTVAAAATGASGGVLLGGPGPVVIDSPFVFLIRDRKNGSVLFMGRVVDPRGT
jgi:serpin B